jgi:FlaA1/EpsC-like NDP-sugar epimerase
MFIRLYFEHTGDGKSLFDSLRHLTRRRIGSKNLVIIGAGDCGEIMYREIRDNAQLSYNVVGFLDDNPNKFERKIHGVPVLGKINEIKPIAKKLSIDEALIAIPSANSKQMRRIVDYCKDSEIDYKTIPGLGELINGRITVNTIREVAYRDLLGRDVVKLDVEKIGAYLANQCVLVTGAGGSIGSELCRQICRFRPQHILLYERAESPLYEIELELKQTFAKTNIKIIPLLADILDQGQLQETFEKFKPNVVFHAAAYKHVPMLEMQPWKAVVNNIFGTLKLVSVANQYNTDRFVFVSTDKAVRSTNVMGATKRMAEMVVQGQNGCHDSKTRFMTVRFGNVVGSAGSVVPLFKKQIAKGGPLTVTHPEVTRYFMTIPEACQLILQAGSMGKGGEIFLLDMGTPIKIADMARDLIRFSGFEPDVDIKVEFIGMRPGEKLHEELITEGEGILPTSHEKILVLQGVACSMETLNQQLDQLQATAQQRKIAAIKSKLKEFIPDYQPQA